MNERIKKAYASAPKTWVWQLLAAFIVACLLAWSGTAVKVSNPTGNGLEVAGNILSGIFHPSTKLLFTFGTNGVPYLLLETFCIAFLGTVVGAVISLPLSFLSASNLVPKGVAFIGLVLIAGIRTIPAFVYGLMFIRVTGPGPFAGLLTMSLCSIGMVSKMFIESIEDLDKRILESLDAAGCTTFQKIRYGILPQLTADFTKDLFHMADLGFTELSMEPVVCAPEDPAALTAEDLEIVKDQYELLAKDMLRREKEGKPITFYHYMLDLTGGPCIYKRISGCGSGTEYMAVTPWGDLYPCHQFVGEEAYKLGDIWNGVTNTALREEFRSCNAYARPECNDCWARFYCSGGCAANAFHATGSIRGVYEAGCELFRKRIECAIMMKVAEDSAKANG